MSHRNRALLPRPARTPGGAFLPRGDGVRDARAARGPPEPLPGGGRGAPAEARPANPPPPPPHGANDPAAGPYLRPQAGLRGRIRAADGASQRGRRLRPLPAGSASPQSASARCRAWERAGREEGGGAASPAPPRCPGRCGGGGGGERASSAPHSPGRPPATPPPRAPSRALASVPPPTERGLALTG